MERAVYNLLSDDSDLSTHTGGRIYHAQMPQKATYPCVTFQRISTSRGTMLDGVDTLSNLSFQVDIWSRNDTGALVGAGYVAAVLDNFQGTQDGFRIQLCRLDSQQTLSDFQGDDKIWRIMQRYIFTLHD